MNKTKYMQTDSRWGSLGYPYAPCYLRNCGCGEVSIANVIIEQKKYAKYTPKSIIAYCRQFAASNCDGTYWSGIPTMLKHYGFEDVKECATMSALWKELEKGERVAIYLMGSRRGGSKGVHWTSGGHFVASVGYKYENGKHYVYMKDSYSNSSYRNGWISYEENIRGDVIKVWCGKLPKEEKPVKIVNPTKPYEGKLPSKNAMLKIGDNGEDVKRLQAFLNWAVGSHLNRKGHFRSGTEKYLKAWQKSRGLEADGIFGAKSRAEAKKMVDEYKPKEDKPKEDKPKEQPTKKPTEKPKEEPKEETWVDKANAWAIKTAKERYHYVRWKEKDAETHTCPICKGRKYDDHYGWNCIGWAFAIWHHGGGLKTRCNCHVIADAKRILNAKTDKEAYDEAVKRIGTKDLKVIRNGGKSVRDKLKAGDICWTMSGGKIQHTWYYMGDGKYSDSTSGRKDNIKAGGKASSSLLNKTVLAIRYTGK